ncbi:MotA/TolQ/ExbB proton channel family protein [Stutzerimonas marianensis]|uniref:MotA/TolQ/ExbB proton channel family protein n=1 Tax=Stutzerimonas marianensis TaxID=2929513 RepID=A0A9X1W1N6_9GAMM|nr:MotA/TolQ/ExbB proton channel family protein [Pseudomonas marianensis]MCJ0973466.1 MotA/TolQ/ExbB proton channel family protein [Pseudomonas marianensis]
MLDHHLFSWLHLLVGWLLQPVTWALFGLLALAICDAGVAGGERLGGLRRWRRLASAEIVRRARRRLDRADLIARVGPMLGLMGTLIPLGPGLAALGDGNVQILSVAMRVAFDTTVLGLLIGMFGFALGRLRRRWYDELLDEVEAAEVRADE